MAFFFHEYDTEILLLSLRHARRTAYRENSCGIFGLDETFSGRLSG